MKIRAKFILTVTPLFVTALIAVFAFNVAIFKNDKIAYVFSTTLENTKSEAEIVNAEIRARKSLFEVYTASFNFSQKKFSPFLKGQLQSNETIQYLEVAAPKGFPLDTVGYIPPELMNDYRTLGHEMRSINLDYKRTEIRFFKKRKDLWIMALPIFVKGFNPENYIVTAIFKKNPFQDLINKRRSFDLFLLDKAGEVIFQPDEIMNDLSNELVQTKMKDIVGEVSSATKELTYANNHQFLVAWTPTADTNLGFVAVTSKSKATSAIQKMFRTSMGLMLLLISIGLIVIILMVTKLTNGLELLTGCMTLFSDGKMDVKSDIRSKDEVGIMSKVFNQMTGKIVELIKATADKARMESELDTAKSVQQRFVPAPDLVSERFRIAGFYEPASECGGDWWFYTHDNDICLLMVADVTGHGVGSALMTGSLRAGVAALRTNGDMPLSDYVGTLNKVICDSGQEKNMATFFVAKLNLKTGLLEYVNASHCAPLVRARKQDGEYQNIYLDKISGKRLGENSTATYITHSIEMPENSLLFCFTDGLSEFTNEKGRMFGEKKAFKAVEKSFSERHAAEFCREDLLSEFRQFQKDRVLDDDLTFCFLHYRAKEIEISEGSEDLKTAEIIDTAEAT